jgi:aspartate/methionine/tyrosine aminotransferase
MLVRAEPVFVSCISKPSHAHPELVEGDPIFKLDIEKIKQVTTKKTKIIIFSNPWNPLGITISKEEILKLLDWCEKNQIYLIIDEAYKDYSFNKNYESVVPLINKSKYLIEAASFSKCMAMSGWRIGYIVIPEEICEQMGKTQDAILNCPNVLSQYATLYALDHPELTHNFCNIIKKNLSITINMLAPLKEKGIFDFQIPTGGFFLFLKTDQEDAHNLGMSILSKAKVSLVPGKFFGNSGAPFLRLCYAREEAILREGLNRLIGYFL